MLMTQSKPDVAATVTFGISRSTWSRGFLRWYETHGFKRHRSNGAYSIAVVSWYSAVEPPYWWYSGTKRTVNYTALYRHRQKLYIPR